MFADAYPLVIIESGTSQLSVVEFETQRMDQMQLTSGISTQAYNVARIGRDLWFVEDDVKHVTDERLATEFCGMKFNTPLVLLSGCVGFGEEYTRIVGFSNRDAGGVCLKGTTLQPRLGNALHRIAETPDGMLNSIGLQNPGARAVVDEILPTLDFDETRFIANVSGVTIEEYESVTRIFDDSPIDAIEINISCPNVKEGGVMFGNDPDMSARVVEVCRRATGKPIITKLSPNQTDIALNARRCIEAGSDGLAVINTLMGMAVDIEARRPLSVPTREDCPGRPSNRWRCSRSNRSMKSQKRTMCRLSVKAESQPAEDALEFLLAGAAAVGIGTALFYDPLVCPKINDGLVDYLNRHSVGRAADLIGALDLN